MANPLPWRAGRSHEDQRDIYDSLDRLVVECEDPGAATRIVVSVNNYSALEEEVRKLRKERVQLATSLAGWKAERRTLELKLEAAWTLLAERDAKMQALLTTTNGHIAPPAEGEATP